jgi:hypothetical protein
MLHSSAGQRSPEFTGVAVTVAVRPEESETVNGEFVFEMEASAGFEPAVEVLQTSALPLG